MISWFHPCSTTYKDAAALGQCNGLRPSTNTLINISPLKFQGGKAIFRDRKFSAETSLSLNRKNLLRVLFNTD